MKTIIFILMLQATIVALAQTPAKLSDSQRKKILQLTDQALEKWAPSYNRHFGTPIISNMSEEDNMRWTKQYEDGLKEGNLAKVERNQQASELAKGRTYYIVTYQYDPTVEMFTNPFAAQVYIWRDNNKVFQIVLGSMIVLNNLDKPQTKGKTPIVSPHVPQKPPKKFIIKGTGNEPDTFVITNQY